MARRRRLTALTLTGAFALSILAGALPSVPAAARPCAHCSKHDDGDRRAANPGDSTAPDPGPPGCRRGGCPKGSD